LVQHCLCDNKLVILYRLLNYATEFVEGGGELVGEGWKQPFPGSLPHILALEKERSPQGPFCFAVRGEGLRNSRFAHACGSVQP
jgi:hypothetical protein